MAKVKWAIPTTGNIHMRVFEAFLESTQEPCGHEIGIMVTPGKPVENTRNISVMTFLEEENEHDYLLFVDSDNPPRKNPMELVELDKDVMVIPTPMWRSDVADLDMGHFPWNWSTYDYVPERDVWEQHRPHDGLQEIDAGGTGCMIIARRVLEHPAMRAPFMRKWTEDGIDHRGSDLLFCKRAKEAGFTIWTHYDYVCSHFKEIDLLDVIRVMNQRDISQANRPNINTASYWNGEWEKRGERILPVYEWIAKKVGGKRVLDFGCGRGDLLAMLGTRAIGVDHAPSAIRVCRERGFIAECSDNPAGNWDAIVSTQVLEHADDDRGLLEMFFRHTNLVIYSVPNNCLPPGVEPEHRRVYTTDYVERMTPHFKRWHDFGHYLVVEAER